MSALVDSTNIHSVVRNILTLPIGSPIAVDCETTGLQPYHGDVLRGFSIAFHGPHGNQIESYYIPVGYGDGHDLKIGEIQIICGAIESIDPIYVYHHSKFDLRFLRMLPRATHGGRYFPVPGPHKLWDTKLVAFLIDENLSTSLEFQCQHHLGEGKSDYMTKRREELGRAALIAEGVKKPKKSDCLDRGWKELTAADTAEYGAQDAALTLRLREHQIELMRHPMTYGNPLPAVEREHDVQRMLLRLEDVGILIDQDLLAQKLKEADIVCQQIEHDFLMDYGINVASPKQVAELLFDTLEMEADTRSTAKDVLKGLEQTDVVKGILRYRKASKARSGFLAPLTELLAPDGRIHPTFWQHGTVTGRFSCSEPNLQTIPRHDTLPGVREVFVAPEGYELWSFDLAAAEARVVAGMAQEAVLIDAIAEGSDIHAILAERVFGPRFTGLQRRFAKNIGYGFFYGLSSPQTAMKYISGPDARKTAVKILSGLKEMYPEIVRLMKREQHKVEKAGYEPIHDTAWPGRFRRFVTEAKEQPFTYTALNARVQGGIGEMMKDIMLEAEPELDRLGARMCLQVHDELVIEVPLGAGQKVLDTLQTVVDRVNPFDLPMVFTGQPYQEHE